jgi:hypothetical protein
MRDDCGGWCSRAHHYVQPFTQHRFEEFFEEEEEKRFATAQAATKAAKSTIQKKPTGVSLSAAVASSRVSSRVVLEEASEEAATPPAERSTSPAVAHPTVAPTASPAPKGAPPKGTSDFGDGAGGGQVQLRRGRPPKHVPKQVRAPPPDRRGASPQPAKRRKGTGQDVERSGALGFGASVWDDADFAFRGFWAAGGGSLHLRKGL